LYQTPVGPILNSEPGDVELYVQCTKNAPADITVKFEIAPEAEVEGLDKFPENSGIEVTLPENTVTIAKGTNRSNSVFAKVDISKADWSKFDGKAYLLPIRITSVSGGAVASVEKNYAYIGVNVDHKDGMLNPGATSATGSRITDCSAWTGTYSVPATGRSGSINMANVTDDNQWSYAFFFANHADGVNEEVVLDFDLGEVKKISGCLFRYYFAWYTIKDGTLYTSTDGVDYTDQGTLTWDSNGIDRYFIFWAPMDVRYIRLVSHSFYGGTGEGTAFSDFNVYE
ncbi:MAG: DUF1735 domain-containing protein, partial [Paramuribaculum sp.]|nr:DUF1735 domain-containing protein [Paramuribaculum sp.]